ncbi:uncharacterized protein [Dysidea avara]|uniref:uncharacterized protein n=1 Tax=Dysidea avara TaxID=196820 RepID=UPI003326B8E0
MFDVQRIWDAWPGLRHTQTLRAILRECTENEAAGAQKVLNMFVVGSHVFLITGVPNDTTSSSVVYVFDVVPKSHQSSSALGGCVADNDLEEVGLSDRQKVQLLSVNSVVIDVICNAAAKNSVFVIEQNGSVHLMQFTLTNYTWSTTGHTQLNPSKQLVINSILFDSDRQAFVWCQADSKGQDGLRNYSVHMCEIELSSKTSITSGDTETILNNAPLVNLYSLKGGVCLLPRVHAPPGLTLYWNFGGRKLIPHLWYHGDKMLSHLTDGLTNFKSIVIKLTSLWRKGCHANEGLVAMHTSLLTGDLLALDNEMNIYRLQLRKSHVDKKHCSKLLDPIGRFQTLPLLHKQPITEQIQLFSYHNYNGVLYKGCLRLYENSCGELIYYNDDFEGLQMHRWCSTASVEQLGLWSEHGVWIIRSKKIAEHAQLLAQGLFPVTTNADELQTTPGYVLPEGQRHAADLCRTWGLHLQATKYAITAVYSNLKVAMENEEDSTDKEIPAELMELLTETSLQSPALLVALLVQFPVCRGFLKQNVKEFLSQYYMKGDDSGNSEEDESPVNIDSFVYTPLNIHLAPLLQEYDRLVDEYDAALNSSSVQFGQLPSVGDEVKKILEKAEGWIASRDGPITKLLSKLESLTVAHPVEALQSIKEFIGVENFQEACQDFTGSRCTSHNWKTLFAAESGSIGQLQCPSRIPLFEIICELLYLNQPDQLLGFINFARVARDTQPDDDDSVFARKARKTFFYQRALDVLIPCESSVQSGKKNQAAVKAYCQLLLLSERPDAEVSALDLLLNHELWSDAISLTAESCKQNNPGLHNLMFYKLLGHLLETGKLKQYYNAVWKICPPSFSIFDLLSILKQKLQNETKSENDETLPPVLASNPKQLTVNLVLPQIYELLERAGLHTKR